MLTNFRSLSPRYPRISESQSLDAVRNRTLIPGDRDRPVGVERRWYRFVESEQDFFTDAGDRYKGPHEADLPEKNESAQA